MKNAHRLARSGAVTTARHNIHRERPFGLVVAVLAILGAIIAGVACNSNRTHAGITTSTATPTADHVIRIPFASKHWPPPPLVSTCDVEVNPSCN